MKWNRNMLSHTVYSKKSLRRLHKATSIIQMELQLRGINQQQLSEPETCLFVDGIIYGIAHIPSNKIYVGQTIHSAYSRFKRHWYSRKTSDHRNRNLHRLMAKQDIANFIVWPLEKIDSIYT